ncbi:phage tail assembly protein [Novosphingobium sp. 9]|uniref:phage tail assembly protein n=1 Tax=Novosphingobium sp. 9 TaxID=2025349 RepID=UPI0021B5E171|nr:phage tail assembly protein [Novosphingobium sp. 9]
MAEDNDTAGKSRFTTVPLEYPVIRGETKLETLDIRKPKAGELRGGLTMQDILTTDATAMLKLIPRVTNPPLTPDEAADLEPEDFAQICGTIRGFFLTKAERTMMDEMVAEHQPKT